jgi:hypothetical protein
MRCAVVVGHAAAIAAALLLHAAGASAQGAEARDPSAPTPSRWAADFDRIDEDVRLRLLTPSDPRANWVRASLDKTDIASQVTHYAAARVAAPQEKLYLASLAMACLQPTQPVLPECDAVDRLADWARRDEDNGVPTILLADRARRRGERDKMLEDLAEAADKPRFDEYWSQGALTLWDYFRDARLDYDPAARAFAALEYATELPVTWPTAMQGVCANPREKGNEPLRAACARLGDALAKRAASWTGRLVGVTIAYRNAANAEGQSRAEASRGVANRLRARCDDLRRLRADGLESADAAQRARDLATSDAWIRAQAREGEVGACERLAAGSPKRP